MGTFYGNRTTRKGRRSPGADRALARRSMHGTFASSLGRLTRALQMESYPKFHNEVGVSIVRIGCREFKCIGDTALASQYRWNGPPVGRRLGSTGATTAFAPLRSSQ